MNPARQLYLAMYSRIDSIDHLIKNCNIKYHSWKYWHSPMLHGMGLAIVTAYDIYLEVCEGKLDQEWKVENPVDFWTFRELLYIQMLDYDPKNCKYIGDTEMRPCTSQKRHIVNDNDDDNSPKKKGRGCPSENERTTKN